MIRRLSIILIVSLTVAATGCAVQGTSFEKAQPRSNEQVIYVYRPYSYFGVLLKPAVTCGDESARIGPGGYHAFIVPAGKVKCSVESTENADEVDIHPDAPVHYIREEIPPGILTGHPHLNPIDHDIAQTEIQSCCVAEQ
jgi:hypothetical protein